MPAELMFYLVSDARLPGDLNALVPTLLEKILAGGHQALVRCPDAAWAEQLNEALWQHTPSSFLPHGGPKDATPEQQPVYITAGQENPAGARMLLRLNGAPSEDIDAFDRVFDLFMGTDSERQAGRTRYKHFREKEYPLKIFTYTNGRWEPLAT